MWAKTNGSVKPCTVECEFAMPIGGGYRCEWGIDNSTNFNFSKFLCAGYACLFTKTKNAYHGEQKNADEGEYETRSGRHYFTLEGQCPGNAGNPKQLENGGIHGGTDVKNFFN